MKRSATLSTMDVVLTLSVISNLQHKQTILEVSALPIVGQCPTTTTINKKEKTYVYIATENSVCNSENIHHNWNLSNVSETEHV